MIFMEVLVMQNIIIIGLMVLLCITINLLILSKREIEKLRENLSEINKRNTNELLKVSYPNKNLQGLIMEINNAIKIKKDIEFKYKEKDLELRQSIANMSHDLRTPLTSIMGYMQLLEDDDTDEDDKKLYMSIIERRSTTLKELISNFYDLSRIQADEYRMIMEDINLSENLCEIIALFYDDLKNKGLEPKINIQENIGFINGDEQGIARIFTNLMQNALKYAKSSFCIVLKNEGKYVLTEFSNDVCDLKDEDVPKIFDRFFTADRMRTGQNTGLGLAITKSLVEKMGHEIWAEKVGEKLYIKIKWRKKVNNYITN